MAVDSCPMQHRDYPYPTAILSIAAVVSHTTRIGAPEKTGVARLLPEVLVAAPVRSKWRGANDKIGAKTPILTVSSG